jgi:hypothetical protein
MNFEEFNKCRIDFINNKFVDANKLSEALEGKNIRDPLIKYLSSFFYVESEKFDDTKKFRFDIILYHKTDTNKNYPLIIECKRDGRKRGVDLAQWCMQCKEYSTLLYKGNKISVFCFPQISYYYLLEGAFISPHFLNDYVSNTNSFIFHAFKMGELTKVKKQNFVYMLCANNLIFWRSDYNESFDFNKLIKTFSL